MRSITTFVPERYRYSAILLKQLVKTEFKLRYQGSALGYAWSLLKPFALFVILYIVFSNFIRVGDTVEHFSVYLLLGIVLWTYFAEVTVSSVESIVARGDILRKVNFPRYVIVLAGSFSALINLGFNLLVVFGFMYFSEVDFRKELVLLPLIIMQLFVLSLGISFFLSALYVRLRDIRYIWELIMQGAFYLTPILYPLQLVLDQGSKGAAQLLMLNPMAQIIQDVRYIMITEDSVRIDQVFDGHLIRLVPYGMTIAAAVFAGRYFKRRSKYFAEEL